MLPFVFSLGLPLLAGVNPPTWSLREVDESPDLRTLEAAETLDLGTRPVDALDAALHKAAPPLWWMLCDWLDAPRSPELAIVDAAVCVCDDQNRCRWQKLGDSSSGGGGGCGCVSSCRRRTRARRAPASLREAALELETVELATARKTDATDSSYAVQIRGVISVSFGGRRAEDTFTFPSFRDHYGDCRSTIYETGVFRLPDSATRLFSLHTFNESISHAQGTSKCDSLSNDWVQSWSPETAITSSSVTTACDMRWAPLCRR